MSQRRAARQQRREARGTGVKVEAAHRHHATVPAPAPGQHLWTVVGMWRVADPTADRFELDSENLLTIEGPGCFLCEQTYSPAVAAVPCPGDPGG